MSGPLDFAPDEEEEGERGAAPSPPGSARPSRPPSAARSAAARRPGPGRWGWLLAIVVLLGVGWLALREFGQQTAGSTGLAAGARLPPFAAPLALSDLEGDVNVARRPDSGAAGARRACEVRGPDVLNVCALAERGPVVLGFLATRGGDCTPEFDRLQTMSREFPGVQVAAVAIRGDRDDLRALIEDHGWTYPVGHDRDGVLAGLYGVAVCPQVTYAYPGGEVRGTTIGAETEAQMRGRFARLAAAARERGWRPGAG